VQVGRYGPEEFDFSRVRVIASVSESLQRLQVCPHRKTLLLAAISTCGQGPIKPAARCQAGVCTWCQHAQEGTSALWSWCCFMQVDYIDVIQTHDIEFGDLDQVQNL
jgi:hypothetical protein